VKFLRLLFVNTRVISRTAQATNNIPRYYALLFRWNGINGTQLEESTFQKIGISNGKHIKVITDAVKKATELSGKSFVTKQLTSL
jgi:hypothetical protein